MGGNYFLKCGWRDRLYRSESIFKLFFTFYFLGNCFYRGELCSAQRSLIQCRWIYEGKKIWASSWPTVASRYIIALIWAIERCNPLNVTAKELCLTAITPVQTASSLLLSLSYCAVTAIKLVLGEREPCRQSLHRI